jgi:hypothetical protein
LVKLSEATKLYQPVRGTDADSIYHAVAIGEKLNVAARIKKDHAVTIRVEGAALQDDSMVKLKYNLVNAGLTSKDTHCSIHLSTASDDLTRKSIGAMIFAIGYPFKEIATDLTPIWNKGV